MDSGPRMSSIHSHRSLRQRVVAGSLLPVAVAVLVAGLPPASVSAAPATPPFGRLIENYAAYQPQSTCSPTVKPGVAAFRDFLMTTYPQTRWIGITRACHIGGRSEHKEGRALDWSLSARDPGERAIANEFLTWLLATDRYRNAHAMARRLGIMYVIWNRRIWSVWNRQWSVYCVQRPRGCVSPSGSVVHPHDDHIHFSFGWPGARKRTSFFTPQRSWVVAMEPGTSGYWLAGGNGTVRARGPTHYGGRGGSSRFPFVDLAATPTRGGYWLLMANGRVFAFGDAMHHGQRLRERPNAVGMASTETGRGYWVVGRGGGVRAFGDAPALGGVRGGAIVGMAATPTGTGYWLFSETGAVHAFGDAEHRGDLTDRTLAVPIVAGAVRPRGNGYWLVNRGGRVFAFGAASHHGNLGRPSPVRPVAAIASTTSGNGYWLAGRRGRTASFGDAPRLGGI